LLDINADGVETRHLQSIDTAAHDLAAYGHEQHGHLVIVPIVGIQHLALDEALVDVKWYVLAGFEANRLVKALLQRPGHLDSGGHQGWIGGRCGRDGSFGAYAVQQIGDGARDPRSVNDNAVLQGAGRGQHAAHGGDLHVLLARHRLDRLDAVTAYVDGNGFLCAQQLRQYARGHSDSPPYFGAERS